MYRVIAVLIGTVTKSFRFRSETKDGAAVYFDSSTGISYQDSAKFVLRMAAPATDSNDRKAKFSHIGQARIPFVRVTNGVSSYSLANVDIAVRTPVDLTENELTLVSDHLKALAGEHLLARAVRERTEPGWEAPQGGSTTTGA